MISESDQYALVMTQKRRLGEGQKWRIIDRMKHKRPHPRFEYFPKCHIKRNTESAAKQPRTGGQEQQLRPTTTFCHCLLKETTKRLQEICI